MEIRCLLDQLAMRLLTLSQATFLPNQVPSFSVPVNTNQEFSVTDPCCDVHKKPVGI